MDDLIPMPKTTTGNLDQHVAGAFCYVPVAMVNVVAPILFLATEPKEHYRVRFHAAQSLMFTGLYFLGTFIGGFGSAFLPILFMILGEVLGMQDMFALVGVLIQLLCTLLLLAVVFGGLLGFFALAALTGMEKDPRIPILASLADRFVGPPPVF